MEIVITPQNPDLLKNTLLLPSLINMIALKNAVETHSALLQQENFSEVSLSIRLIREQELDLLEETQFSEKIVQALKTFFLMAGEEVEVTVRD